METVSLKDLAKLLLDGSRLVLIDLRKEPDYAADPRLIPGAVKWWLGEIESWGKALPPGRLVVVYCAEGKSVGAAAAAWLGDHGHDARQLEGGFSAWRSAGLPLEEGGSRP